MPAERPDTPPLRGVRVVEVGAFMAAPFATMQLADLGADVVKVENPKGPDPVRAVGPFLEGHSSPYLRLNRNKRSLALDLKAPGGARLLRRLLDGADVLVENLRPGAMARLGLGYDDLAASHPHLVYASASGWGQDGPLAPLPGLDIMAQARSGLMSITGPPGGEPAKVGVPVCDLVCGLYVALGVLAALRARERTGRGQHVDVSLLEAGTSLAIWEAARYWVTGESGTPQGSAHQSSAPYQALRTADGWLTVGAITPNTWRGLCEALGLPGLLADERYGTAHERHGLRAELIPAIECVTRGRGTEDLVAALDAAGVPCAPINTTAQVFTDPHLSGRGFFWDAEHPELGAVRQIGSPVRLSATPARRGAAGPGLGEHTAELLAGLGLDGAEVAELLARGVVAGPETTEGGG
ncbi:CaiB/BaiF CoA transferase family protein [Allonocardiopsis opalescens]|uniref:Formyl-CoA transferase n=1 Tax=Allonocardiopsis opalescens TaxID=1144618 RepID=A0A2T0Q0H8_9ACTN|nr:CoA transferase [Allonocardiopsis opalescens]PRX97290.1 formyl-CoA transferase [Allonocardiopsis opalescens]